MTHKETTTVKILISMYSHLKKQIEIANELLDSLLKKEKEKEKETDD